MIDGHLLQAPKQQIVMRAKNQDGDSGYKLEKNIDYIF